MSPEVKRAVERAREVLAADVDQADPTCWARRCGALEYVLETLLQALEASR
ncbi:MAG TPA: hypothetical protein VKD66_15200 [Streptosporangiaceae bacterium]|nr:hypothetical protein [Streptosporangiaceae bacterium]